MLPRSRFWRGAHPARDAGSCVTCERRPHTSLTGNPSSRGVWCCAAVPPGVCSTTSSGVYRTLMRPALTGGCGPALTLEKFVLFVWELSSALKNQSSPITRTSGQGFAPCMNGQLQRLLPIPHHYSERLLLLLLSVATITLYHSRALRDTVSIPPPLVCVHDYIPILRFCQ